MINNIKLNAVSKQGNVFDIEESILNTAEGDNGNLYFECNSPAFKYYIGYFSCCGKVYISGFEDEEDYDMNYWNYDKLSKLENDINKCKYLNDMVNTMLDYLDEYSIYRNKERDLNKDEYEMFIDVVLKNSNLGIGNYEVKKEWSDLDHIIFIMDNQEYNIRMWNIDDTNGRIEYTLFKSIDNHGEELSSGIYYFPKKV